MNSVSINVSISESLFEILFKTCETIIESRFKKCRGDTSDSSSSINNNNHLKQLLMKIGIILICTFGITANILCIYLFRRLKSFKNSSYIFYLKFLSLSDTLCLLMELLKPLNQFLAEHSVLGNEDTSASTSWLSQTLISNLNDLNCKLVEFFTASFHLSSAWLICAFSLERCIAVYWPLLIRQLFNITRTKYICWFIFIISPSIQLVRLYFVRSTCSMITSGDSTSWADYLTTTNFNQVYDFLQLNNKTFSGTGCLSRRECQCTHTNSGHYSFFGAYDAYFHRLTCLVIIPTLVVVTCNSMVFYRIIQRRRMINSGKLLVTIKMNKNQLNQPQQQLQPQPQSQQQSVPMIKVTLCGSGSGDPEVTISSSLKSRVGRSHSTGRLSLTRHTKDSIRLNEFRKSTKSTKSTADETVSTPPTIINIPTPGTINEVDSYNSALMTIDDEIGSYSTTFDETTRSYDYPKSLHNSPSMSSSIGPSASAAAKNRRNKINKRNRDIKLALLMIFSGAFLVFVLPEILLNIYLYWSLTNEEDQVWQFLNASSSSSSSSYISSLEKSTVDDDKLAASVRLVCQGSQLRSKLSLFLDLFHMLKLLYFSSNFLAYLTLTTFSRVKRVRKPTHQHQVHHQQLQQQ